MVPSVGGTACCASCAVHTGSRRRTMPVSDADANGPIDPS